MEEEWREIPGYEGYYEVSNLGRVRSLDRLVESSNGKTIPYKGKILSQKNKSARYRKVGLWFGGSVEYKNVHTLVATAFLGPPPQSHFVVCHNNGNPFDNKMENLRWDTPSENSKDRVRHGRDNNKRKTHCPQGHAYTENSVIASSRGYRKCKRCHAAREYKKAHAELDISWMEIARTMYSD